MAGRPSTPASSPVAVRADTALDSSIAIFATLLEAMGDRGADVLEQISATIDELSRSIFCANQSSLKHPSRSTARLRQILTDIGLSGDHLGQARDTLLGVGRLATFVSNNGQDLIPQAFHTRFDAISKDVTSLSDYETHLANKVQFLLDAVLGYISIDQNDLFQSSDNRFCRGSAANAARRYLGYELQKHAGIELGMGVPFVMARLLAQRHFTAYLV